MCGSTVVRNAGWNENAKQYMYGLNSISAQIMPTVSCTTYILLAGIFAASLSSAIASLVGAPKVFQAVATDNLFPYIHYFGKGSARDNEPRRGYVLAFAIGMVFIAIGQLNAIAPLISNFFLISYALINGACFVGSLSNSPGWRPTFRWYNKWISLVGFVCCSSIMFLIDYKTALITFFLTGALFAYLTFREPDVNWGTSTQAFAYLSTLHSILRLQHTPDHVKTFRPQCLVLTGNPMSRQAIVTLVGCITKNSSMMVCGNIINRVVASSENLPNQAEIRKWILGCSVKSFYAQMVASDYRQGAACLMQIAGIGKFKPNVVFMGYKEDWKIANPKHVEDYVNVIFDACDFECAVCILRQPKRPWQEVTVQKRKRHFRHGETVIQMPGENIFGDLQKKGTIDIWWLYDDGGLTVLIPHLISLNWRWEGCKLRVFISGSRSNLEEERDSMIKLLRKFRVDVEHVKIVPEIINRPSSEAWKQYTAMQDQFILPEEEQVHGRAFIPLKHANDEKLIRLSKRQVRIGETIRSYSNDATMVVINLPVPRNIDHAHYQYMCWLETLSQNLPPTIIMRGNQENVMTFYS